MRIQSLVKLPAPFERIQSSWLIVFFLLGFLSIALRFVNIESPLIEPHPWRQTQTALTTYGLFHKQVNFWFYESPFQGKLWSFVFEFPIYQGISALLMKTGLSLESASRIVSIFFFLLSTVFLFLIISTLFSQTAAWWTSFFYLISPFDIIFSRTALIDNCVQCFMLASLFFFLSWTKRPSLNTWFLWTITGAVAAASKITIWIAPWLVLTLFSLKRFMMSRSSHRTRLALLWGLGIQITAYLFWSYWTDSNRTQSGFDINRAWIVGEWSSRFELWRWIKISKWILRNILADWMILPFFIGLFSLRTRLPLMVALGLILFAPLILFFNVYTYHDYYLIAQAPYLIATAGLGMGVIPQLPRRTRQLTLFLMGLLLLNHLRIVPAYLEPMFQTRSETLSLENNLKAISAPDELLFARVTKNPWQVPLYSERLVATAFSEQWVRSGDLSPSVFYFPPSQEDYGLLSSFKTLGVIVLKDQSFFRVKESPTFPFDLTKMIIITDTLPSNARIFPIPHTFSSYIELCNSAQNQSSIFFELPKSIQIKGKTFTLRFNDQTLLLPTRRFLSLPKLDDRCDFSIVSEKGRSQ